MSKQKQQSWRDSLQETAERNDGLDLEQSTQAKPKGVRCPYCGGWEPNNDMLANMHHRCRAEYEREIRSDREDGRYG